MSETIKLNFGKKLVLDSLSLKIIRNKILSFRLLVKLINLES